MASTIQLKTGTGSAVPSSLTQGEVGINVDNGLIYYGSGSGNTVKKLESFTHITASGNISASGKMDAIDYFDNGTNINTLYDLTPAGTYSSSLQTLTNITASGNISASGFITSKYIRMSGPEGAGNHRFIVAPPFSENDNDSILLGGHVRIDQHQAQTAAGISTGGSNVGNLSVKAQISSSTVVAESYGFTNASNKAYFSYKTSTDLITLGGAAQAGVYTQKGFQFTTTGSSADIGVKFGGLGNIIADSYVSGSSLISETHITASGNISASGTIIGSNLSGTNTGDQNITNLAITGSNVIFNHITASGNISSSGNIINTGNITSDGTGSFSEVNANHYYGYFYDSLFSNATLNFNNSYFYLPLTGQSTAEHASTNANERIPITNPFNGHPVKTSIRSTNNAALNGAKITASIHFEPAFNNDDFGDNSPGTIAPGVATAGHILFKEVHATGISTNHSSVMLDWRNAFSSSGETDIPSGSRITLSMKSDKNSNSCYVINTVFAWKHDII